ncbi:MAG TPA: sialate O-acetylesterase [Capsulimonadaceae bacterium]|jgi:hypothetical protein
MATQHGVTIVNGPSDWQIIQQNESGHGRIELSGTWRSNDGNPGVVEVRVAFENTSASVTSALHWRPVQTNNDGTWTATIGEVPAGGLYRLETRLNNAERSRADWSQRGDVRHFIGVGDLWVIAGQSNSAGYGRGPYNDPPEFGIHMLRNSMEWSIATQPMNESTDSKHPVNSEGSTCGHSPYLNFARVLKQHLDYPIGLIQTSLGGSPLHAWNPTEPGEAVLYHNMVECVKAAGGTAKGVVWYQGESDCGGENAITYADRFLKAVAAWRTALNNPELCVITVQLNRHKAKTPDHLGWSIVREAQRTLVKRDANITVVPSTDLPLTDHIHNGPAGNMVLGERMAKSALQHAYEKPIVADAPDLQSVRRMDDGTAIELTFSPVVSFLAIIDENVNPFLVVDDNGTVPIVEVTFPENIGTDRPKIGDENTILLRLDRALVGDAKIHGGYGADPLLLPMDMERTLPVLAFYNVPVE